MPEEQWVDNVEKLRSDEQSLGERKLVLINDLLKQRADAAAVAEALDEKLAKLGYQKNTTNTNREPQPGDKMPDGTIYAGISPDTKKPMYAMPADASLTMAFIRAKDYALEQGAEKACGHDDWRVPTKGELNVLFNNRAAIGGFDVSDCYPLGWYWSSSRDNIRDADGQIWSAWGQQFSDGRRELDDKTVRRTVRLVR